MQLYTPEILRLATRVRFESPLEPPYHEASGRSRVCGSHMDVRVRFDGNKIAAVSWSYSLCATGQACLGLLSGHVLGLTIYELTCLYEGMQTMLKTGEVTFDPHFEDFAVLKPAHKVPSRHGSILLPLECLLRAFHSYLDSQHLVEH